MQAVTKDYKDSMKSPLRNRGYIKVVIGVYNQVAQKNIQINESQNTLAWWSNNVTAFDGITAERHYATGEDNFSVLDGSMYFIPDDDTYEIYNGGIITNAACQPILINFGSEQNLDIKGWTIDFGENYPIHFYIETEKTTKEYFNDSRYFRTEDVFNETTTVKITPAEMRYSNNRLRILKFDCGIVNSFTNKEVLDYTWKDYASSITDSIPSQDMSLTVDNQNLYYSPNNPDSTLAFMELGQKITVSFGYDVTGNNDIEWVNPVSAYLKSWTADEQKAKFTAVDIFDYELTGKYNRGQYYANGASLYDLAEDIFDDAGLEEDQYYIDPYLKTILVNNPIPKVKHSQAIQIVANAGRCALTLDRNNRIRLQSSFVPKNTVTVNNIADWGSISQLLKDSLKDAYADGSEGFDLLSDQNMFFLPDDYVQNEVIIYDILPQTLNATGFARNKTGQYSDSDARLCGYVSKSYYDGSNWVGDMPVITVQFEAAWTFVGMFFKFRNVYAEEFNIKTYYFGTLVSSKDYTNDTVDCLITDEFALCDKVVVSFTKGSKNSRLHLDSLLIGDVTDYHLSRSLDIVGTSTNTRNAKIKSIDIVRTNYSNNTDFKKLTSKKITLSKDETITIELSKDSYGYAISTDDSNVTATILSTSAHVCEVKFTVPSNTSTTFTYTLEGYEYLTTTETYSKEHHEKGEIITWKNPLITSEQHAKDIEEWLSDYYLGDVSYTVPYRGDPRVDANDLFYLKIKDQDNEALIRAYQTELKFSGAWSGSLKARKADLAWQ